MPFLDGKDDKLTLLSWDTENQEDYIRCDGSRIIFEDKQDRQLLTLGSIPYNMVSFELLIKVKKKSSNARIDFGFQNDSGLLRWRDDGKVLKGKDIVGLLETFNSEDSLSCNLQRIMVDDSIHHYCKFSKNNKLIGSWVMDDTENFRPQISFWPLQDTTETAEVETNFLNKQLDYKTGIFVSMKFSYV